MCSHVWQKKKGRYWETLLSNYESMVLHWCNSFPPRWLKCKHSPDKSQMLMCPDVLEVLTRTNSLRGQLHILMITGHFYFCLSMKSLKDVFGCAHDIYAWEQIPLNMPLLFSQRGSFYLHKAAERSQCQTLVQHAATVCPLLSHRSKVVLNVTVTGDGFPSLLVRSVKRALVSI